MKNDFHNRLLNNISFTDGEADGNRKKQLQKVRLPQPVCALVSQ